MVSAFPWATFEVGAIGLIIAWAALCALLLSLALSQRLILTMTVLTGFALAYSQRMGDALTEGLVTAGVGVGSEWVLSGLLMLAAFMATTLAASASLRRALDRFSVRRSSPPPGMLEALDVGVLAFLAITAIAAWTTGAWSYWGDSRESVAASGGIRLELSYPAALIGIVGHGVLTGGDSGLLRRWPRAGWVIGAVVVVLLFILQSRRLMIGAGMLVAIGWLCSERLARAPLRKLASRIVLLVAGIGVLALASFGWRELSGEPQLGIRARMERALGSLTSEEGLAAVEERLTYLWFDAVTQELVSEHGAGIDGFDLLESDLVRAVPRLIMPSKAQVPSISCESAFDGFGLPADLPCTPTAEGFLVAGVPGVLLAGLLWGLILGLGDLVIVRGPSLASVFAFTGLMPLLVLEGGLFGVIDALRSGFLGFAVTAIVAYGVWFFMRPINPR